MLSMLYVKTYDQSKGGDTRELQSRMVPTQNNWVESPYKLTGQFRFRFKVLDNKISGVLHG